MRSMKMVLAVALAGACAPAASQLSLDAGRNCGWEAREGIVSSSTKVESPQRCLTSSGIVEGIVVDTRGRAIQGVRIWPQAKERIEGGVQSIGLMTSPNGRYVADLVPGQYAIRASHPDWSESEKLVIVRAGATSTVNFQLQPQR